MIDMSDIETIYENDKDNLIYQTYKLTSSYWRKKNVYERWFLGKIENTLDDKRYNVSTRAEIFNAWVEAVMYFLITRNHLKNWNKEKGTLATYIYNIIDLNEYIFAYQILFNLTQNEAISYARHLKEGKSHYNSLDTFTHKSILCSYNSLDEPIKDKDNNDDVCLGDLVEDNKTQNVQKEIEIKETLKQVLEVLNNINSDNTKNILKCYIENDCNYSKAAKILGCSRQNVEQNVKRFRRLLERKGIRYED